MNATVFIDGPSDAEKRGQYQEKSSAALCMKCRLFCLIMQ
ncbi:hypothetical protein D088_870062 [Salmonella enterica subsp. houtenae serovar 16:z4,z32:-- str. RKS3027]|nr:hypothetical protein D088_870062 [Salmonella enterica subsp. houtenae serovar 16:z4,z32:-- str. RKS3027]